jgi:hypothetical protein
MKANAKRLLQALRPFRGRDVRVMCAMFTLAVALPRLPLWPGAQPTVNPLRLLPPEVFGWICLVLGIALLLTSGRWRCRFVGRSVAFAGLLVWALLAGATTSATSFLIDIIIAYAMFGEIGAGCHDF